MKIAFEKNDLLYSLGILQGVSVKNEAMPILSTLMMEAENGLIHFTGNNLECGVRTQVEGIVTEEGVVAVNSKKFLDMVKELPKGEIGIEVTKKHRLNITSGKGKYTIIGQDATDFPRLPEVDSEERLSVDALSLNMVIQRVSFAAHTDPSNALNSLHFKFLDDRTEVAATRRAILSIATLPPLDESLEIESLTIPMQAVREISRVFSNSEEVSVVITEAWLLFTDGISILTSRIVESEGFPPYQKLVLESQSDETKSLTLMKDLFINSLKRVLVLANPQSHSVKLEFKEGIIELSSNGPEIGQAEDHTEIIDEGFEGEIAIDGDLLLATLGRISTETVELRYINEKKPLFVNATSEDVDNLHVSSVMPVRLTNK